MITFCFNLFCTTSRLCWNCSCMTGPLFCRMGSPDSSSHYWAVTELVQKSGPVCVYEYSV